MSEAVTPVRRRRRRSDDGGRSRPRTWLDFFPLISLAIFLTAVVWVIILAYNWLAPAGDPVTVPEFMGTSYDAASASAAAAHVGLRVIARRPDFHAAKDVVVGQLPAPGERVREGRTIDLILSAGVPMVKVPNLSNMSVRDARLTLENARLELGTQREVTNVDVVAGQVLDQHPDPFTSIRAGSKVDVTIAKGWPLTYAPTFIDLSIDFVKRAAQEAHIKIGDLKYQPLVVGAKPKGIVVAQDPAPGQPLSPHTKVALQVSGGAPPTPTPSPSPETLPSNIIETQPSPSPSPLLPSPNAARMLRISVALPKFDRPSKVRVVLQDASGARTLFEQETVGGVTLSFDVSITGAATIETYAGDELISTTPL